MALTIVGGFPLKITGTTAVAQTVISNELLQAASNGFISHVYWYKPTTAGHLLSILTSTGKEICKCVCEAENQSIIIPILDRFYDIVIDDMDSGEVQIFKGS